MDENVFYISFSQRFEHKGYHSDAIYPQ